MKLLNATLVSIMLAAPLTVFAQSNNTPKFDKGQDHLQTMEDKAKADGKVTRQERARLQHAEDKQSKRIYRQKHDRQHDYNHDGKVDRPHRGGHV